MSSHWVNLFAALFVYFFLHFCPVTVSVAVSVTVSVPGISCARSAREGQKVPAVAMGKKVPALNAVQKGGR